jgi:hypothetical protein
LYYASKTNLLPKANQIRMHKKKMQTFYSRIIVTLLRLKL